MDGDISYWKMKYEHLSEQFERVQKRNEELEERILNVVEKVEHDKITLSDEIDDLAAKLVTVTNKAIVLESDCARYKQDCVLAVHLLQCAPSKYVASSIPARAENEEKPNPSPSRLICPGVATFPPTGIYFDDDQPEDPTQDEEVRRHMEKGTLGSLPSHGSFTRDFVDKIKNDIEYSVTHLRQCETCGTSVPTIAKGTQTEEESPLPVVFMSGNRLRSLSEDSSETIV